VVVKIGEGWSSFGYDFVAEHVKCTGEERGGQSVLKYYMDDKASSLTN
jgi:hypothetical protein